MEVSGGVFWVGGGWADSFIDKWEGGFEGEWRYILGGWEWVLVSGDKCG